MKKSLRIFALMMAALTALSVMSVTMADTPKYYIGFAEADGNSPLYAGPGTNYSTITVENHSPFVLSGTKMYIFDITDDLQWCRVAYGMFEGYMRSSDLIVELRSGIVLKNGTVNAYGKIVAATPTYQTQSQYATGVVTASNVNFRQGPGKSYAKVSGCPTLPKNAQVTILEDSARNNGWYKLQYGSHVGYMSADYV